MIIKFFICKKINKIYYPMGFLFNGFIFLINSLSNTFWAYERSASF